MAERVNAVIADAMTERLLRVGRVTTGLRLDVWRELAALEADILAVLKMSDPSDEPLLRARRRAIEDLMDEELDPLIRRRYSALAALLTAALLRLARHEAGIIQDIVNAATGTDTLAELPSDAVLRRGVAETLIPTPQRPTDLSAVGAEWWERQGQSLSQRIRDSLLVGVSLEEPLTQLTARIKGTSENAFEDGIMARARTDAATVVQTQVTNAVGEAHVATATRNATSQLIIIHTSILDSKTSAICLARHGLRFTADTHEPLGHSIPYLGGVPYHPNCIVGLTRIFATGIQGTSQREYIGEVITIRTQRGYELTCTPNHPILTHQGWIAAHKLDIGSNLFCCTMEEGSIPLVDMDSENRPACIEDIVRAREESCSMASMPVPVTAEDFHSDGKGSKIAIIGTNGLLRNGYDAQRIQPFIDLGLLGLHAASLLQCLGLLFKSRQRNLTAPTSLVSRLCLALALLRCHESPFLAFLLAMRPQRNAVLPQTSLNHTIGNTITFAECIKRHATLIGSNDLINRENSAPRVNGYAHLFESFEQHPRLTSILSGNTGDVLLKHVVSDNIVHRQVRRFKGHVYNLHTTDGWYVSNNIITHNCRSSIVPGVRDGGPLPEASVTAWLKQRTTAYQDAVLGPTRAQMWRLGTLSPRALIDHLTGKPLTLEELGA